MPPFPKPKRRPSKRHRERAKRRMVDPVVDARDGFQCRCCNKEGCDPLLHPLHHRSWHRHHIQRRSDVGPETTANKIGLCGACHRAIHDKQIDIIGTDANVSVTFGPHVSRHQEVA